MENLLDKPFSELTSEELKQGIQTKFGTISRLCRLTKRDINNVNKLFKLKRTPENLLLLERLYLDAKATENRVLDNELTEDLRKKIKAAVYAKSNNILEFCEKYGFRNSWISTVINGDVTKKTTQVKELLKVLDLA